MTRSATMKNRVSRLLSSEPLGALAGIIFGDRIPSYGIRIDTSRPVVGPGSKAQILFRQYESAEIRIIRSYLPTDVDVVELGSSLGVTSSHIARKLAPGRRLVCVEANAALIPTLRANLELHAKHVEWHIENAAIHYEEGPIFLDTSSQSWAGRVTRRPSSGRLMVPATSLSELVEKYYLSAFTLFADIEGSEVGLLLKDSASLSGCRSILVELHDSVFEEQRYEIPAILSLLEGLDYRVVFSRGRVAFLLRG